MDVNHYVSAHVPSCQTSDRMFFTNITGIRTLATMYKLVSLHGRLITECFFTNITGIRMLVTMY